MPPPLDGGCRPTKAKTKIAARYPEAHASDGVAGSPMKVFVSWSGQRSQAVAEALSAFLTKIIQSVEPFISTAMDAGVRWNEVIAQNLDEHGIGILCVTPGNVRQPWLNYEAGALSLHLDDPGRRVVPYLLDFGSAGDLDPPLSQFNAVTADRAGTWKLVQTLNRLDKKPQSSENLSETFEAFWPKFEIELEQIRASSTRPPVRRSDSEKLDELLAIGNQLLRRSDAPDYDAWYRSATGPVDSIEAGRRIVEQVLQTYGDRTVSQAQDDLSKARAASEVLATLNRAVAAQQHRALVDQLLPESISDAGGDAAPSSPSGAE